MKKILAILGICILLGSLSTVSAVSFTQQNMVSKNLENKFSSSEKIYSTSTEEWTGEFVGAFGNLQKVDGEWDFTKWGYLAGVYKGGNKGKFGGKLFDLNETEFGTIGGYYGKNLMIGRITIDEQKAPIIGFLFKNETMFFGRIMSIIGPAPHIIGYHQAI